MVVQYRVSIALGTPLFLTVRNTGILAQNHDECASTSPECYQGSAGDKDTGFNSCYTALVDALGGPAEFHGRFSFDVVDSMIPNANFSSSRRLDRRHIHDPLSGTVTHHLPP